MLAEGLEHASGTREKRRKRIRSGDFQEREMDIWKFEMGWRKFMFN
jgi:hypothetical protein